MKTAKSILLYIATLLLLVACGGGSETLTRDNVDTGDGQITPEALNLVVSLQDAQGIESTVVADGTPLTIKAKVTDSSGIAQPGLVVTFVLSQNELADFSNDTGTALTNDDGIASINLTVGTASGSGTVTASVENAASVVVGFDNTSVAQAIPSSLELFASTLQLASSGADSVQLIAVVKNDKNILLEGVPVTFAADQNASLTIIDSVTQADGTARATLTTENNKENREITVSASTSAFQELVKIEVVGTKININGAKSMIINDSAPITIVLSDSDGNGIANQEVTLTSTLGTLDYNSRDTSSNGQVTVTYTAFQAGDGVITASALSESKDFIITVQQDDFSFNQLPTQSLDLNTDQALNLRWFKNNTAFANGTVVVTTSRGTISGGNINNNTATTAANGIATVTINSRFAGPASISAVGTDTDGNEVSARAQVEFVASNVDSIFVDATPDIIGPDGQTSTITAVLRDEIGNLVKDKTVNFTLISDASGGNISPNTATTDSNGIASTVYTSNAVSGDIGVTIGAQYGGVSNSVDLTVGNRAFDIVLGTGNEINEEDQTTYIKEFAAFVTDASGRPVADAALSASVVPTALDTYRKGFWVWDDTNDIYVAVVTASCPSEDANRNGMLDAGEDINNDGFLTPGNVAIVNFKENDAQTNDFGQATLQVRYPQQFALWTSVKLTVLGQSSGTESRSSQDFGLSVAASDLTTQAEAPPSNPFGSGNRCDDTN